MRTRQARRGIACCSLLGCGFIVALVALAAVAVVLAFSPYWRQFVRDRCPVTVTGHSWKRSLVSEIKVTTVTSAWEGEQPPGSKVLYVKMEVHHDVPGEEHTRTVHHEAHSTGPGKGSRWVNAYNVTNSTDIISTVGDTALFRPLERMYRLTLRYSF